MSGSLVPRLAPAMLAIAALCFTACNPTRMPGGRQIAKQQEERITRETEEAIKKSPVLQELDHMCTREVPRPDEFVPINKYGDLRRERFLGYGYRSGADYQSVKSFYINYFTQHGWQLTNQKDAGWGQPYVEFSKDNYKVKVYRLTGDDGINYSLYCEKLSSSVKEGQAPSPENLAH